jgi:hypothetical protein
VGLYQVAPLTRKKEAGSLGESPLCPRPPCHSADRATGVGRPVLGVGWGLMQQR